MKLRSLSLILTEDCNFDCGYCYKSKHDSSMTWDTVEASLSFFLPFMEDGGFVIFYGGEPCLEWDKIERAVPFVKNLTDLLEKDVRFSVTTNGSLLTEHMVRFLAENSFTVVLSFDSLAQEIHRQKNSFAKVLRVMESLLDEPRIDLDVNCVFTPSSVRYLADSIHYLMNKEVPKIQYNLSALTPWERESLGILENQLGKLVEVSVEHYARTGGVPVENFGVSGGRIFRCMGGQDRLAVTPQGEVWGCDLFTEGARVKGRAGRSPDWARFRFGKLDDFVNNGGLLNPGISQSYGRLSTDNYSTAGGRRCFLCGYLSECRICPMEAVFAGAPLGTVPDFLCEIQKIRIKARKSLQSLIGSGDDSQDLITRPPGKSPTAS